MPSKLGLRRNLKSSPEYPGDWEKYVIMNNKQWTMNNEEALY